MDLGAATPKVLALYDRALAERADLKRWIEELTSKSTLTIRDRLCLALYRHQLLCREPPLPARTSLNSMSVYQYWTSSPQEYRRYDLLLRDIESYLWTSEERKAHEIRQKRDMLNLYCVNSSSTLLYYPIIESLFGRKRGRPATRRGPRVVSALQMSIDTNLTWLNIAKELCDCPSGRHDHSCAEVIRLSTIELRKLLGRCGIEVPDR